MSWFPLHSLRIYLLAIQFCIESSFLSALEKCAISFYPPWFWMRRNPPSLKLFSPIGSVLSPGYFQDHFFALVFRSLTMVTLACISWGLSCLRFASVSWICRFMRACVLSHFSCVQLYGSLWTVVCQASLSMGFSRQEYWSRLPWPPPGDRPNPRIKPVSLMSPALAGRFFTTSANWKAPL